MVLNHIAAILLFSGPLFYIGLWMVVDPAGILALPALVGRLSRELARSLGRLPSEDIVEQAATPRRVRTALRLAGVTLLLLAIVV